MKKVAASLAAAVVMSLALPAAWASPTASVISQVDWEGGRVTNAGRPFQISIFSSASVGRCAMTFTGPSRKIVKFRAMGRTAVATKGLKAGFYDTTLRCGKSPRFASGRVAVVPSGKPVTATCDVIDSGFSNSEGYGYTSVGIVLANRSPYVGLDEADVIINLKDSSGNILSTETESVGGIPPSSSRIAGWNFIGPRNVTSVEVVTSCRKPGAATWPDFIPTPAQAALRGNWVDPFGSITNTWDMPLNGYETKVHLITRDASGRITGGDNVSLADIDVPPGVTVRWSAEVVGLLNADLSQATTVEAGFIPKFSEE